MTSETSPGAPSAGTRRPTAAPPASVVHAAGRLALPEYHAVRGPTAILKACLRSDLAAEITLRPVCRHGVDAAIVFSDNMTRLAVARVDVDLLPVVSQAKEAARCV